MEKYIMLNIQKLPEWKYLATSESIQGLVAQWDTFEETIDIAQDIAKKLLKAQKDNLKQEQENIFYPMLVKA